MSTWRMPKTVGNKRHFLLCLAQSWNQYFRLPTDFAWSHHKCVLMPSTNWIWNVPFLLQYIVTIQRNPATYLSRNTKEGCQILHFWTIQTDVYVWIINTFSIGKVLGVPQGSISGPCVRKSSQHSYIVAETLKKVDRFFTFEWYTRMFMFGSSTPSALVRFGVRQTISGPCVRESSHQS